MSIPAIFAMLIAYEDRRFLKHRGVDPFAVLRASWQMLTQGRVVSGASTLTMQVARLLEPRADRSVSAKLRQMIRAIEIDRARSKAQILDLYLTLAPYGGNIEGLRAASFAYFGKEPKRLSIGEAAFLVALPQSPETRRPDRFPEAAERARARVLERARERGLISGAEAEYAKAEPIPIERQAFPALAAHAAEEALEATPGERVHQAYDRCAGCKPRSRPWRASGWPRSTRASRPPSSSSTTRRASCGPMWDRPISSRKNARARST